jgi:hypothetical protein
MTLLTFYFNSSTFGIGTRVPHGGFILQQMHVCAVVERLYGPPSSPLL